MRRLILILGFAVAFQANALHAQLAAPNASGASMGHLHLIAADVEAAQKFWMTLGATPVKFGAGQAMKFPGVLILLRKGEPAGGSAGTVVGHFSFSVPHSKETLAKWNAAGLKTETASEDKKTLTDAFVKAQLAAGRNPGQFFVYTPDGLTRIEILQEEKQTVPVAFHHIHFYVAASAVPEIQAWYAKMFGAVPGKRGANVAADLPGVNLTFSPSETPVVGTKGRKVDHIGFEVKNLEALCQKLEANGVKLDSPYNKRADGLALAFLTDPWGTYIELTEGLNSL